MDQRSAFVLLALLAAPPLRAAEAETEGAIVAAPRVEITVVGSEAELTRLRDATAPSDLQGAEVSWRRAERFDKSTFLTRDAASDASVRAFVVLSEGHASLYFADRATERFLVREVPLPDGLDALGSDAVSQVLTLSVAALRENSGALLTRDETEKLLPAEPAKIEPPPPVVNVVLPPEPERSRSFVGATLFYALRAFGGGVPIEHGPGLRVAWVTEGAKLQGSVWLGAQYMLPSSYETATAAVDWTTVVLRGGLGLLLAPRADSAFRFGGALGAGADLVNFTPRPGSESADLALAPPGQSTIFALSGHLVASLRLDAHLDASAEIFCDIYPTRVRYALTENGAPTDVLVPFRVRPGFALALSLR